MPIRCMVVQPNACVAIVRFGAAGDLLLTASTLAALRQALPHARLVLVTHERHAELARGWPWLDAICSLASKETLASLTARVAALAPDALLDLHGSWRSWFLGLRLGIPRRTWRKRRLVEQLVVSLGHGRYLPDVGQAQRYHQAAEALFSCSLPQQVLRHVPHPDHLAEGRKALGSLQLAAPQQAALAKQGGWVVLNPGAAWSTKRWPSHHFAALAARLVELGHAVLCVGSEQEAHLVDAIVAAVPAVARLPRPVSLAGLAGVLSHARLFVSGDTGPMHLARGMGVRCVVLFGSTPAQQFDLTGHTAMSADVSCSPCSFYGRPACPRGHMDCLELLSPQAVARAAQALLM